MTDRSDDLIATITRLRSDVDELQRLGASRWGSANPNEAWGKVASATKTTAQNTISTVVDVTGQSITFTGLLTRLYKVSATVPMGNNNTANVILEAQITNAANTRQQAFDVETGVASGAFTLTPWFLVAGTGASLTYKLRVLATGGTVDVNAGATDPCIILAEDIGLA